MDNLTRNFHRNGCKPHQPRKSTATKATVVKMLDTAWKEGRTFRINLNPSEGIFEVQLGTNSVCTYADAGEAMKDLFGVEP